MTCLIAPLFWVSDRFLPAVRAFFEVIFAKKRADCVIGMTVDSVRLDAKENY